MDELQSSGGDDNLCIAVSFVFALGALAFGGLRFKRRFGVVDCLLHTVLVGIQALYLVALEQGSLVASVVLGRNVALAA